MSLVKYKGFLIITGEHDHGKHYYDLYVDTQKGGIDFRTEEDAIIAGVRRADEHLKELRDENRRNRAYLDYISAPPLYPPITRKECEELGGKWVEKAKVCSVPVTIPE